mmetsp:Transcript_8877/g.11814  ORF Transcript_8877/g.11814 Transcript_8877/m.11814 type:complete len:80 (-) Transcript_8877:960-1199(-)
MELTPFPFAFSYTVLILSILFSKNGAIDCREWIQYKYYSFESNISICGFREFHHQSWVFVLFTHIFCCELLCISWVISL